MEIKTTLCNMFDCLDDGIVKLLGDDKKEILLCEKHYQICREAIDRRFKD